MVQMSRGEGLHLVSVCLAAQGKSDNRGWFVLAYDDSGISKQVLRRGSILSIQFAKADTRHKVLTTGTPAGRSRQL